MSDSDSFSDQISDENTVDSDGYSTDNSSSDSSSGVDSDDVEVEEDIEVVRGAEPYRFEPVARPRHVAGDDAEEALHDDADENIQPLAAANERLNNTDWCSRGSCVVMEFAHNCMCCKEVDAIQDKIQHTGVDAESFNCFTDHPWYEATCLNPGTLETAYYHYKQQYGARAVEGNLARKYRHVSYRQVVRWCWGFLGRHNRVPLPSCIMHKVRATFPDEEGNYVGFSYSDLDEM